MERTRWTQSNQEAHTTCLRGECPESHQMRWISRSHWLWQAALSSEIDLSTRLKGKKDRRARTETSIPTPSPITDVTPGVNGVNHASLVCSWGQLSFQPSQPISGSSPPAMHLPLTTNPQLWDRHGCGLLLMTFKATLPSLKPRLYGKGGEREELLEQCKSGTHALLQGVHLSNLRGAPSL